MNKVFRCVFECSDGAEEYLYRQVVVVASSVADAVLIATNSVSSTIGDKHNGSTPSTLQQAVLLSKNLRSIKTISQVNEEVILSN